MNGKVSLIIFAGLLFLVYLSCTNPGVVPASLGNNPSPVSEIANNSAGMEKEAWQVKWDSLQKEAKKEGILSMYSTSGAEVRDKIKVNIIDFLRGEFTWRLHFLAN